MRRLLINEWAELRKPAKGGETLLIGVEKQMGNPRRKE